MDQMDQYIEETFPDEDQRKARRAKLFERIGAFLDEGYVGMHEGDGFARITREQVQEMWGIFYEIAALKVSPDCDGDNSVEIAVAARHMGRLTYTVIPNEPTFFEDDGRGKQVRRDLTADEELAHISELSRAHTFLSGTANHLSDQIQHLVYQNVKRREQHAAFLAKVAEVQTMIETKAVDFKEASRAIYDLPSGEENSKLQVLYRQTYADVFGAAEEALLAEIDAAGDDLEKNRAVREKIIEALPVYGSIGLARAFNRFNNKVGIRRRAAKVAAAEANVAFDYHAYTSQDPDIWSSKPYTLEFRPPEPEKTR